MVELRKRKTPPQPPAPAPARKKSANPVKNVIEKAKEVVTGETTTPTGSGKDSAATSTSFPAVGSMINLDGFGGEIETHEGQKTTLKQLVDSSTGGVVLFTYPKASTPGCTKQACMFRDDYTPLTATGFSIFGLSRDSPKSNTTFKTKQNLPYTLLCDTSGKLISAIGLGGKATATRGVFVVDKSGKVLAAEAGGPEPTVQVVKKLVTIGGHSAAPVTTTESTPAGQSAETDTKPAETAAQVADSAVAAKLDPPTPLPATSSST